MRVRPDHGSPSEESSVESKLKVERRQSDHLRCRHHVPKVSALEPTRGAFLAFFDTNRMSAASTTRPIASERWAQEQIADALATRLGSRKQVTLDRRQEGKVTYLSAAF